MHKNVFAWWLALPGLGLTASTPAWSYESAYYELFAGIELAAASIANPSSEIGFHSGNATNIAVGGGKVYFQDGVNIYSANPNLTNVTLFHVNGVAPTDIAIDAADGIYYESFAGIELAAASIANPSSEIGFHSGNATNIAFGGGKVYFQDGVNIYSANPNLTNVTLFHVNGVAPTDIAIDAVDGIYYESFAGIELAAASIANPSSEIGFHNGNATNIAFGGGKVYFQDGVDIYSANPDLTDVTLFHVNGVAPTDLAVYTASVAAPEPKTWVLLLIGMASVGWFGRRRVQTKRWSDIFGRLSE